GTQTGPTAGAVAPQAGRGADWGIAVHTALEAAARGGAGHLLRAACRVALIAAERPVDANGEPVELDELVQLVEAARQAPFWARAERARAAGAPLVEAPFAVRLSAGEYDAWLAALGQPAGASARRARPGGTAAG